MDANEGLDTWFVREILPLEPTLTRFLRRNWTDEAEIADLRQEAYVKIYEAAQHAKPTAPKAFLFKVIKNILVDRQRRNKVIPIGSLNDLEGFASVSDEASPEQNAAAKQEITRLQEALDTLSDRVREVVILRKVHGMSQRDVARNLGIQENTVEQHVAKGVRVLAQHVEDRRGKVVSQAKRYVRSHTRIVKQGLQT
jgi:RNA polymerase sigma factor (sigma-70 family)